MKYLYKFLLFTYVTFKVLILIFTFFIVKHPKKLISTYKLDDIMKSDPAIIFLYVLLILILLIKVLDDDTHVFKKHRDMKFLIIFGISLFSVFRYIWYLLSYSKNHSLDEIFYLCSILFCFILICKVVYFVLKKKIRNNDNIIYRIYDTLCDLDIGFLYMFMLYSYFMIIALISSIN